MAIAKFVATLVFPTPPLPPVTAMVRKAGEMLPLRATPAETVFATFLSSAA